MSRLLVVPFLVLSLATPAFATENSNRTKNNNYPIVLVRGYEVYTATVGPIVSNWDRACELYAYIKGGRVDYGKIHSEKYGHSRYR